MLRAARFVSQLGVHPDRRGGRGDGRAGRRRLGRITAERVQGELTKLLLGAHPRRGLELLVDTGLADVVLPELPALRMEIDEHHQHKDVYAHSLTVLDQADRAGGRPAPTWCCGWPRCCTTSASRPPGGIEPGGGVTFHHHEVVGAKLARTRLRALQYPKDVVEDVSRLILLHLRFHGYGRGEWTDSAVRRYVTDAGPLLARLHKLVRSDCTTRNQRRAAALSPVVRRAGGADRPDRRREEDLRAVRPDLDGNEIMRMLGLPPGPAGRPGLALPQGTAPRPRPPRPRRRGRRAHTLGAQQHGM